MLRTDPGPRPIGRRHVLAILGCIAAMSGQAPGPRTPPPTAPGLIPPPPPAALAGGLVQDSQRLSEAVQREIGNSPRTQAVRLKVNTLLGSAEQLDRVLRSRGSTPQQQRQAVRDLRSAYQPVAEVLSQPGLNAPGSQRIGERIGQKLASVEDLLGVPRPGSVPIEVKLQRALIREYTAMIGEVDTFMTGLNDKVPEGPQIRVEALALRDAVRQLRRYTAQNAPIQQIAQELAAAAEAQRVLANRVERLNRGRAPGPNVLRLRRIGEILARIQASARLP
ncbi:MAG: hypothetical protein U0790_22985 [Isosphaeraceae bacterium]